MMDLNEVLTWPNPPSQTYVLKLARSGEEGEKVYLLIESGARFHTIDVGGSQGTRWMKGVTSAVLHCALKAESARH